VTHQLKVADNQKLELYDFPGEYAQRFDGVDPGGGDRSADLGKIFEDNKRTVAIRMQEEAYNSIVVNGTSTCRNLVSGHKFTLERHGVGDGEYVLERVFHAAHLAMRAGSGPVFSYHNSFTCFPAGLPFRPVRSTTKPIIPGTQTAVVVGPPGEEIFTDKYGRVKVQFHWDREGKNNAGSSCWVRVAQIWAGKRWGASFWPRIGQEVVVSFVEGDPDQPIIVGSVYNADQMPPYLGDGPDPKHKNDNKVSGIKTNSTPGGDGFNEIRFDDTKDKEQIFIHAQRNMDSRIRGSMMTTVGGSSHLTVGGEKEGKKTGDIRIKVFKDLHETIGNDEIRLVERDQHETIKRNVIREVLEGSAHTAVPKGDVVQQSKSLHMASETDLVLKGKAVSISAVQSIQLAVGGNFILIDASGITIFGTLTRINCPGSVALPAPPTPPTPPAGGPTAGANTLKPEDPVPADNSVSGSKSAPG
jgi:type VI secretion system secreted protein VgrG